MKYKSAGTYAERKLKRKERVNKLLKVARSKVAAMPRIPRVILNANYVNPITLEFPKGMVVYELRNRTTGRTNYYDKETFRKLILNFKGDYNLLMRNPKVPITGVRNPVTRGAVYPRNIRQVTVAAKKKTPSQNAAVKKIQSAYRKRVSKKTASPKPMNKKRASK
jgi:hypothetical protein